MGVYSKLCGAFGEQLKVQLGWKFPMKTVISATRPEFYWYSFGEWQENFRNNLFEAPKTFLHNRKKPIKIFTKEKCLEDTFQFVHYVVYISKVKMIESREESFAWGKIILRHQDLFEQFVVCNNCTKSRALFQNIFKYCKFLP